jgi:hypothetical protein
MMWGLGQLETKRLTIAAVEISGDCVEILKKNFHN